MPLDKVLNMCSMDFLDYFEALNVIEARNELQAYKVSGFPHWKEDKDRKDAIKEARLKAFPSHLKEENFLSNEDAAKQIQRMLGG
jgi:hypothetical protein